MDSESLRRLQYLADDPSHVLAGCDLVRQIKGLIDDYNKKKDQEGKIDLLEDKVDNLEDVISDLRDYIETLQKKLDDHEIEYDVMT